MGGFAKGTRKGGKEKKGVMKKKKIEKRRGRKGGLKKINKIKFLRDARRSFFVLFSLFKQLFLTTGDRKRRGAKGGIA